MLMPKIAIMMVDYPHVLTHPSSPSIDIPAVPLLRYSPDNPPLLRRLLCHLDSRISCLCIACSAFAVAELEYSKAFEALAGFDIVFPSPLDQPAVKFHSAICAGNTQNRDLLTQVESNGFDFSASRTLDSLIGITQLLDG